jgi:hypothetical protein
MKKPWLSCKETSRLVSHGLDERLPLARRIAVRVHLAICTGCTNFRDQMLFLRKALASLADSEPKN